MIHDPAERCWICRKALGDEHALLLPFMRFGGMRSGEMFSAWAHGECARKHIESHDKPEAVPAGWPP